MAVRQPALLTRPRPSAASVSCSSLCFYPCSDAAGRHRAGALAGFRFQWGQACWGSLRKGTFPLPLIPLKVGQKDG